MLKYIDLITAQNPGGGAGQAPSAQHGGGSNIFDGFNSLTNMVSEIMDFFSSPETNPKLESTTDEEVKKNTEETSAQAHGGTNEADSVLMPVLTKNGKWFKRRLKNVHPKDTVNGNRLLPDGSRVDLK